MPAPFDVDGTSRRLLDSGGGYQTLHSSAGLEVSVYVLVAPEPDRQQPHDGDEVYVVLEGEGKLEVAGESISLSKGQAVSVPAGTDHRFNDYERLSVLVIHEH
jgi:mannose-6-phosphate isomerase-like protein (cupin superfamily)